MSHASSCAPTWVQSPMRPCIPLPWLCRGSMTRVYGNFVKSIKARVSGGNDLRSISKLNDFFTVMHHSAHVNIHRSQIPIAEHASRRIWSIHWFLAIHGEHLMGRLRETFFYVSHTEQLDAQTCNTNYSKFGLGNWQYILDQPIWITVAMDPNNRGYGMPIFLMFYFKDC